MTRIKPTFILPVALFLTLIYSSCFSKELFEKQAPILNWKGSVVIKPTSRKQAKTCILIIAPTSYGDCFVGRRWKLGQRVWEQYMNTHPDVDCYFMICTAPRKDTTDQVWIEGNMIYVGDEWMEKTGCDRLLHKTIKAMEYLENQYTHFIRTNINTFFDLNAVANFAETHSQSFFSTPLWQSAWYTIGYAIVYSADVAKHMVDEYNRLDAMGEELISPYHADDAALTSLATGVWPYNSDHPFRCCPTLKPGVRQLLCNKSLHTKRFSRYGLLLTPLSSLHEATHYFDLAGDEVMLIRTRDGLNLEDLAQLYLYMLNKRYPELGEIQLTDY